LNNLKHELFLLIQLRDKPALLYFPQDRAVDELFRLGVFGARIALGHPGELGLNRGGRHLGDLRVELTVKAINIFQSFRVIDPEIFPKGADRRFRVVLDHVDTFDDGA
jgi:hypothetical protein